MGSILPTISIVETFRKLIRWLRGIDLNRPTPGAQQHSPLLNLPPEVRKRIHELVLVKDSPIGIPPAYTKPTETHTHRAPGNADKSALVPALLRTCHQIRQEGSSVFYGTNTFHCRYLHALRDWLKSIRHVKRGSLRKIIGFHYPNGIRLPLRGVLSIIMDVETRLRSHGIYLPDNVLHFIHDREGEGVELLNMCDVVARLTDTDIEWLEPMRRIDIVDWMTEEQKLALAVKESIDTDDRDYVDHWIETDRSVRRANLSLFEPTRTDGRVASFSARDWVSMHASQDFLSSWSMAYSTRAWLCSRDSGREFIETAQVLGEVSFRASQRVTVKVMEIVSSSSVAQFLSNVHHPHHYSLPPPSPPQICHPP